VFTQTDPLQATVGQAYPSTYIYANNNPNMFVDPSGMRGQFAGSSLATNAIASQFFGLQTFDLPFCIAGVIGHCPKEKMIKLPGGCKMASSWKTKSAPDCGKHLDKFYEKEAKGYLKYFKGDKAQFVSQGLGYYDMFESARKCYQTSGAASCAGLLTTLAGKYSGGSLVSLSPTVSFLMNFNVDLAVGSVTGASENVGAGMSGLLDQELRIADNASLLISRQGSVRIRNALGTASKSLIDCNDGF
jgi:hypothetical protein